MGQGRWDSAAFNSFQGAHTAGRTRAQVFTASSLPAQFDPSKFAVRESRDSAANPLSTPIQIYGDVTGSMGAIAERLIRRELDTVMQEIHRRKPVTDPHILVGATGDAFSDRGPLQMTQFEADVRLADQLKDIWLEGNGGGNEGESYLLAHYAAAMKVSTDSFEKRGRKGFLFTIGDEPAHRKLTKEQIKAVFGIDSERDLTAEDCLAMAARSTEVFHVVLKNVGYASGRLSRVLDTWKSLLGERVLVLDDETKVAETIVSTLQVMAGESVSTVASSWSGSTAVTVANAIGGLAKGGAGAAGGAGFRRF